MDRALTFGSRRPRTTLLLAGIITLLGAAGASRLVFDASLEAMFPRRDPAAVAMVRIFDQFSTADDLLVLVTLPETSGGADANRLLAYARRFEEIAKAPRVLALVDGVVYRAEPDARQFVQNELGPAGLFYLSDAELAAARQRLSPQGMRAQLAHDQAMLSQPGPAASAAAKALMQDPLALHDFLVPHLTGAAPFATYENSGDLISADGRALLIRVLGKRPPTDLAYAAELTGAITWAVDAAMPGGLRVALSGAYPIAALSQRSIRRDAIESVVGSVLLLLALFCLVYRKPVGLFHLAFGPVVVGTLWGFGAYGAVVGSLSPIAAVIGGVLAAMGIDYSVLYLTRYESLHAAGASPREAAAKTAGEIGGALLAAFVTSIAGFLAIGASSVRALRDFSILGTMGLAGSFLAVLFVLPALLVLFERSDGGRNAPVFRFQMESMMRWVGRRRSALVFAGIIVASICLVAAIAPGGGLLSPESDLTVMHPHPNAALDAEDEIARRFGVGAGTILIHLRAVDDRGLVTLAHRVQERLSSAVVRAAGITGTYGLANWLPDPQVAARRIAATDRGMADRVSADFKSAIEQSAFDGAAMEPYGRFLRILLSRTAAPDVQTLRRYPSLARDLLPGDRGSAEAVTVVFLSGSQASRAARDTEIDAVEAALGGLEGVTATGLPVISRNAEDAVWRELPRLLWIAAGLVIAYLFLHFRNLPDVLLSLAPALFGMSALGAIVRICAWRLNMVNLVALPLLIGIDVDYGIYLVSLARPRRRGASGGGGSAVASGAHAILVCASSMIAGYASLFTASVPAVRSLGLIVAAGVACCLAGALFILCPLLVEKGK